MSDISGASTDDPYGEPGSGTGDTQISATTPPGSNVVLHDDGSATIMPQPGQAPPGAAGDHFANLADTLPLTRLNEIARDFIEAVDIDKEARKKRDKQYEEGMRRTGLGDDAPGGATFPGASRVVHPMLTEACIDFSARVMPEIFPPDGPAKAKTVGDGSNEKDERGKRCSRYINFQLTELMPTIAHEFDVGFTQCPLGGAFYTKMIYRKGVGVSAISITIDKVHRPWSDGAIYDQPRITHEMDVDKWEYMNNVRSGLWRDVIDPDSADAQPEQTRTTTSNDKVVGRTQPNRNIDGNRIVYESSVMMPIFDKDDDPEPCILTIDEHTHEVLALYRNYKPDDPRKTRLDFLIEWPFWPWRGGMPIGMMHMIGGLSGAATGSLRALLDAAHLSQSQTGIYLKGGATAGGQNVRAQPLQTTTLNGSLMQDDVRKAYMPLPFPQPSATLFQLLGFLVDAGKSVVRTTFDEFDKVNGQTPVGTAGMFIEQGLKNLGAIHVRLHRSMRRFLKQLWDINAETLDDVEIVDKYGELLVSKQDFAGPMTIVPVSDPAIFSDLQRQSQAQMVAMRATDPVAGQYYQGRAVELYFMKQMKVPEPEQFLKPEAQPVQQNAVAENATASAGLPVKAFPGQDHEAHLATHLAYMDSPIFGLNSIIAIKYLPGMLNHLGEHIALWYADAMLDAANAVLRQKTGNPQLTIESFKGTPYEAPLDKLLAELSPDVMIHANEMLKEMPAVIAKAQMTIKRLAPPTPMDPSVVAMQDVTRQSQADENTAKLKLVDAQNKKQADDNKTTVAQQKIEADAGVKHRQLDLQQQDAQLRAIGQAQDTQVAREGNQTREDIAAENNDTKIKVAEIDTQSAQTIADKNIKAGKKTRLKDGGSMK